MHIRHTTDSDEAALPPLYTAAFGPEEGPVIANLTMGLLHDPTAQPLLSLASYDDDQITGHVLFTRVHITGDKASPQASILAPLAVHPDRQRQGLGTQLVEQGLALLKESGCELVFVLGHPGYYPRFGFRPAGARGFNAPYPIAEKNAGAWMMRSLCEEPVQHAGGIVQCAQALDKGEYWVE